MASTTEPISHAALALLRCPETMQPLALAPVEVLARLLRESLPDGTGLLSYPHLEAGLLRLDGKVLYPILNGVPMLLVSGQMAVPSEDS